MNNLEQYQSDLGENATKNILERLFSLKLKKIPKNNIEKTPDYEILDVNDNVVAVCEVKSFIDTIELTDSSEKFEYLKIAEESNKRDRNHRNKLRRKHEVALSQLSNHMDKGVTTIIFFVSFDMTDYIDMGQVLQEYKELYPLKHMADLYGLVKVNQEIIPSETVDVKETIRLMNTTASGDVFSKTYMSVSEALSKAGVLPLRFQL